MKNTMNPSFKIHKTTMRDLTPFEQKVVVGGTRQVPEFIEDGTSISIGTLTITATTFTEPDC
jgi:hypothetical protein